MTETILRRKSQAGTVHPGIGIVFTLLVLASGILLLLPAGLAYAPDRLNPEQIPTACAAFTLLGAAIMALSLKTLGASGPNAFYFTGLITSIMAGVMWQNVGNLLALDPASALSATCTMTFIGIACLAIGGWGRGSSRVTILDASAVEGQARESFGEARR